MEYLKQVNPSEWEQIPALAVFYDDLASNPYCTNAKGFSYIRTKSHAIKHTHIQPNHPAVCKWLAFDIDDPNALFTCFDEGLPPPQIIIKNPTNGHAHYLYRLTTPVGIGGRSSVKAMRYLASVQKALATALNADKGYSGNLVKNPCHTDHETYLTGVQPSYTLAELANYLDLPSLYSELPQKPANDAGYGRNCALFEELRHIAYKLPDKSYNSVISELESVSDSINNRFDVPLLHNEVKHIIRSIARYCERTDFTESHQRFSELQAYRGAKGGTAKGKVYDDKRQRATELHMQGVKQKDIAEQLGVNTRTLRNWGIQRKKIKKRKIAIIR